ncbi:BnaC05g08890D [Brassica napus]|uniref:(rape) hypothetical protein n=1 Tax=Brassica napus TaxID=3708 RepID=A0A078FYB0_BRANA|nr:unnamed protein product [Brassica napus]CDY19380.1 BnaC05g08890D [Brassica napus]
MPCKTTPILHLSSLSCSTHHCWLEPVVPFSHSKRHLVLPKVPISTKCRTKVAGNVPFTGVCKPLSELSFGFVDVCTGFGGADLATSELFELVVLMQRTSSREEPVNYCPLPLFLSCGIRSEYACRFRPTSSSYSTPSSSYQVNFSFIRKKTDFFLLLDDASGQALWIIFLIICEFIYTFRVRTSSGTKSLRPLRKELPTTPLFQQIMEKDFKCFTTKKGKSMIHTMITLLTSSTLRMEVNAWLQCSCICRMLKKAVKRCFLLPI